MKASFLSGRPASQAHSVLCEPKPCRTWKLNLGVRLFDRTARFPVLTDQGRGILANARAVTSQMDLLKARVKSMADGYEPELTVVLDVMFPIAILTEAIVALKKQFPETALRLYMEGWGNVVQRVLDRRCAVGIMASLIAAPPQLAHERLMTIKMVMVVSPHHPLASHRRPIPAAILAEHIILLHTDRPDLPPGREWAVLSPKEWFVAHIEPKLALLRAGIGFGAVPLHVVERDLASGTLVQIRAEEAPPRGYSIEVFSLYRTDSPPGPAGRWLINRIKQGEGQRLGQSAAVSPSAVKPKSSRSRSPGSKRRSGSTALG